jgi:hypothetical protein
VFWILCSVYWINRQAEFTIKYYTLSLTITTLRHLFTGWPLVFLLLLVPICCLVCVLLAASIIHSSLHSLLAENYFENRTELLLNWKLELVSFGTRYITSAPTTHRKHLTRLLLLKHVHHCFVTQQRAANTLTSIVAWRLIAEMCLPLRYVATREEFPSNEQ